MPQAKVHSFSTKKAPSPQRGRMKVVYEVLEDMGDWTPLAYITQTAGFSTDEVSSGQSKAKASIAGLTSQGYIISRKGTAGLEYKIAPLSHYEERQELKVSEPKTPGQRRWNHTHKEEEKKEEVITVTRRQVELALAVVVGLILGVVGHLYLG